jgi:type VI protein secretion system component VasK
MTKTQWFIVGLAIAGIVAVVVGIIQEVRSGGPLWSSLIAAGALAGTAAFFTAWVSEKRERLRKEAELWEAMERLAELAEEVKKLRELVERRGPQ